MFADLVGSTALSAGMDPEDLRDVFSAYSRCAEETVSKFGGTVAQYMGDGILVYFGYPHAHEDDAEQAVRAGLELVAGCRCAKDARSPAGRVGIATGVVVVSNLTPSIVGETPNLAARLQNIAKPNMVVISEGTRRLLGHFFELEELGTRDLEGYCGARAGLGGDSADFLDEPLRGAAFERDDDPCRPRRRVRIAPAALVEGKRRRGPDRAAVRRGRHRKIASDSRVCRTSQGRALSCACVCSAPRSTPTARFTPSSTMWNAPPPLRVTTRCKRNSTSSMRSFDCPGLQRRTPRSSSRCCHCQTTAAIPCSSLPRGSAGKEQWTRLLRQVEILSSSGPLLVIYEDVHWADPTSLELIGRLVSHIASHRVLVIISFRPEFEVPWIEQAHVTAPRAQPACTERRRRHDRSHHRQQSASRGRPPGHHRTHGRNSAVRRRDDESGA